MENLTLLKKTILTIFLILFLSLLFLILNNRELKADVLTITPFSTSLKVAATGSEFNRRYTEISSFLNNKRIAADNIKDGSITFALLSTSDLFTSVARFNSGFSDGIISISKFNSDVFNANNLIEKDAVNNSLNLKYNATQFEVSDYLGKPSLTLKTNIIDTTSLTFKLDGAGLEFDTSAIKQLQVKVDNKTIIIENDYVKTGRININGNTSIENDTHINYAIQTGSETLVTQDTSSIINAINSIYFSSIVYLDNPFLWLSTIGGINIDTTLNTLTIPNSAKKIIIATQTVSGNANATQQFKFIDIGDTATTVGLETNVKTYLYIASTQTYVGQIEEGGTYYLYNANNFNFRYCYGGSVNSYINIWIIGYEL